MYVTFNIIFVLSVYIKITKPIRLGSVKTCIHYAESHVETYLDREIRQRLWRATVSIIKTALSRVQDITINLLVLFLIQPGASPGLSTQYTNILLKPTILI